MTAHAKSPRIWCVASLSTMLLTSTAIAQDLSLSVSPQGQATVQQATEVPVPQLAVLPADESGIQLTVDTPSIALSSVTAVS